MDQQDQFFLQQVPQSLYRNTKDQDSGERDLLDVALNPIKGLNESEKVALRAKISEHSDKIVKALIPEEDWETCNTASVLDSIYSKLDING